MGLGMPKTIKAGFRARTPGRNQRQGGRGAKSLRLSQSQTVHQAHSHVHKIKHFRKINSRMSQVSIAPQSTAQRVGSAPLVRSCPLRRRRGWSNAPRQPHQLADLALHPQAEGNHMPGTHRLFGGDSGAQRSARRTRPPGIVRRGEGGSKCLG